MTEQLFTWKELAAQLRVDSIRCTTAAGSGHPTSGMSAADLMAVLLAKYLRFDWSNPRLTNNDRLVFSKGQVSGKLALQVMVGPTATERAPYPACPLAKRGADLLERHVGSSRRRQAGSSKSVCMRATI